MTNETSVSAPISFISLTPRKKPDIVITYTYRPGHTVPENIVKFRPQFEHLDSRDLPSATTTTVLLTGPPAGTGSPVNISNPAAQVGNNTNVSNVAPAAPVQTDTEKILAEIDKLTAEHERITKEIAELKVAQKPWLDKRDTQTTAVEAAKNLYDEAKQARDVAEAARQKYADVLNRNNDEYARLCELVTHATIKANAMKEGWDVQQKLLDNINQRVNFYNKEISNREDLQKQITLRIGKLTIDWKNGSPYDGKEMILALPAPIQFPEKFGDAKVALDPKIYSPK